MDPLDPSSLSSSSSSTSSILFIVFRSFCLLADREIPSCVCSPFLSGVQIRSSIRIFDVGLLPSVECFFLRKIPVPVWTHLPHSTIFFWKWRSFLFILHSDLGSAEFPVALFEVWERFFISSWNCSITDSFSVRIEINLLFSSIRLWRLSDFVLRATPAIWFNELAPKVDVVSLDSGLESSLGTVSSIWPISFFIVFSFSNTINENFSLEFISFFTSLSLSFEMTPIVSFSTRIVS